MIKQIKRLGQIVDFLLTEGFSYSVLIFAILVALCSLTLTLSGLLEPIESRLLDMRFQARNRYAQNAPFFFQSSGNPSSSDFVVMAEITDDCLETFGKWPWKRKYFSELVQLLKDAGARVVSFDVSFFDHDRHDPHGDELFGGAIRDHGRVILASELTQKFFLEETGGVFEIPSSESKGFGQMRIEESLPISSLLENAKGTGFVNIALHDGIVRSVPLTKKITDDIAPSLGLKSVLSFLDQSPELKEENQVKFGDYAVPFWDLQQRGDVLDQIFKSSVEGSFFPYVAYLNYLGPTSSGSFFSESVSNILAGKVDLENFRNKIVLVGINAQSMDRKLTPFGIFPGMEIQATVMHNLLATSFLTRTNNFQLGILILILTLVLTVINFKANWQKSLGASLIASIVIFIASTIALSKLLIFVDTSPLILQTWAIFIGARLLLLSRSLRQRILHLQLLNSLSKKLFTLLDPDLLVQNIFELLEQHTGAKRGVIMVIDQVTDHYEYSSFGEIPDEFMVELSNREFRERCVQLWQKSPTLKVHSALNPSLGDSVATPKGEELLAIPLILKDRLYGAMFALSNDFTGPLEQLDTRFWTTLSQIIVAAMENARLYKLATVDGLTGLFVRSFFDVQIQKEFLRATRYDGQVGYLMSDIDHFKGFNDQYGHEMGDRVLRMVSDQIKESVRNVDVAARYGGEELCVILPNTDKEGSLVIAERIRQNIENLRIPYKNEELRITCSIGVSSIPENQPQDVKSFMKQADEALYQAKENGRNQVRYYEKAKG